MNGSSEPDYEKAKKVAFELLESFGIYEPPVNPAKIARDLGIVVNFAEFPNHDNVSGFYNADQNAIYVNVNEPPSRMTFTIAHELGHQRLHREWTKTSDYKILYRNNSFIDQPKDPKEQEANAFAAHLLVPRFIMDKLSIDKLLKNSLISMSDLAVLFAVSQPMVRYRVKNEYGI
jgi:Zn-dependent peptidase ImmA (M78 family)